MQNNGLYPLSFLDNNIINFIIKIILILYSSGIFENINIWVSKIFNYSIIRFLFILLIIYIGHKDISMAILFTLFYIVSLHYNRPKEDFGGGLCTNYVNGKCI